VAQQAEKILKAFRTHAFLLQQDAVAGTHIDGTKEDPFGVVSRDAHHSLLPTKGPGPSKHGKEPKDDFIFHEQNR
jgi:hypothetical protein